MKNVTISMDEDLALWVRIEAAKADMSVSRWLADMIERRREAESEDAYERAYRDWKSRGPWMLKEPGDRYPTREERYER